MLSSFNYSGTGGNKPKCWYQHKEEVIYFAVTVSIFLAGGGTHKWVILYNFLKILDMETMLFELVGLFYIIFMIQKEDGGCFLILSVRKYFLSMNYVPGYAVGWRYVAFQEGSVFWVLTVYGGGWNWTLKSTWQKRVISAKTGVHLECPS